VRDDLLDRVAALLRGRPEEITAEQIARDHLRLSGAGSGASQALVRAILSKDARFEEAAAGRWRLAAAAGPLCPPVVMCIIDVAPGTLREPWFWRVSAMLWGLAGPLRSHHDAQDAAGVQALWEWLGSYPSACERPGLLARWMGAQERIHALSESDQAVIDLRAWARLLRASDEEGQGPADGLHGPRRRAHASEADGQAAAVSEEPTATRFEPLVEQLTRVAQTAGQRHLSTWQDVARLPQAIAAAERERFWNGAWSFTPADIEGLPAEPGIYRFLNEGGEPLYIGKAKNLRGRVASYFRPLEGPSSRRAAFLEEIRSLDTETTGTELEALIREAAAIREEKPSWNTQLQTITQPPAHPVAEEEMIVLMEAGDGLRLFALAGERLAIGPIAPQLGAEELCGALRGFYVEGRGEGLLSEVAGPERVLARRWFQAQDRPGCVLKMIDFPTYAAVAETILNLAGASDGAERGFRMDVGHSHAAPGSSHRSVWG